VCSLLGVAALLATAAPGCRGPTLPTDTDDPVIIGAVLPLSSGGLGGDGPFYRDAMLLAVREINAAGGVLGGRRVELIVGDSEDNPATAAIEAERLIGMGAIAILGDASSSGSIRIYDEVTGPMRIPQISCTSTSISLTTTNRDLPAEDRFFFRTAPPDQLQAGPVVQVATDVASCTSPALLYQDDEYGGPLADLIQQQFATAGTTLVATVSFAPGAPNFTTEVATLRAAMPDCIVLLTYPPDAGDILRAWDLATPAIPVTWIGTDALFTSTLVDEAVDMSLIDGFVGTAPSTTPMISEFTDFQDRLRSVYGTDAEPFQSNCYDAAAVLMLAIAEAGSTDGDAIRDALHLLQSGTEVSPGDLASGLARIRDERTINYEGASGSVDFDEFGDVVSAYVVWEYSASTMGFTVTELR
jgi:ABC-type branched-subunit amino acid transport system substrate-binding protein